MPQTTQRIVPMIVFTDAPAGLEFLTRAFGFTETERLDMPDGTVGHAEVAFEGSVVMVASANDGIPDLGVPRLRSPMDLPAHEVQIRVYVDDLDSHFERARAAGAEIIVPPADQGYGERIYRAADPEGHRWIFAQRLR